MSVLNLTTLRKPSPADWDFTVIVEKTKVEILRNRGKIKSNKKKWNLNGHLLEIG